MSNASLIDALAFRPFNGGQGVRFTVSAVASTPVGVPGSGNASEPSSVVRVRIAISGAGNACVKLNGTADRNSMVMLAGTVEVFTVPFSPNGLTVSAIAETDSLNTTVSAVAGEGY